MEEILRKIIAASSQKEQRIKIGNGFSPEDGQTGELRNQTAILKLANAIDSFISKAKIYLDPGEEPPEGHPVKVGPRQGLFYETSDIRINDPPQVHFKSMSNEQLLEKLKILDSDIKYHQQRYRASADIKDIDMMERHYSRLKKDYFRRQYIRKVLEKRKQQEQQPKTVPVAGSAKTTGDFDLSNVAGPEADRHIELLNKNSVLSELSKAKIVRSKMFKPGVTGNAYKIYFDNDKKAIWKPKHEEKKFTKGIPAGGNYKREILAYHVDQILGFNLVPPTTFRNNDENKIGSAQLWIDDAIIGERKSTNFFQNNIEKVQKGALFDIITGARDRHERNYLVNEDKNDIYLIDNGLSFPDVPDGLISELDNYLEGEPIPEHLINLVRNNADSIISEVKIFLGEPAAKMTQDRINYILEKKEYPKNRYRDFP